MVPTGRRRDFDDRPKIKIRLGNGKWSTVTALEVGRMFAAHNERYCLNWFCVTHGFTGMKVVGNLTRAQARHALDVLERRRDLFRFTTPGEMPQEAREIVSRLEREFHPRAAFTWRFL